ncbi:filamentous hemagglutinin N-terminal domain-containing protein [Gloeocapsa sp. PCC 73106]|uniref:two-partner secretion domain-containing protein n=1 Tax=Gloeocapsa sp. PCC 73106 TaxID=102232 RepID=UPI0002ABF698|nr:filamentous hemagglutinin N-terminal domain-containing protein [Gloeocapsa sp. PCC 73106]ELR96639.1 filamentous hemagglutinin family N-terminal domain protein [Gloeocapsa sp. PCC 73106]
MQLKTLWSYLACFIVSNMLLVNPVVAQIAPDNTLGDENSRVENRGNRDIIEGGATRGDNLFHSFREFNVEAGREAYFNQTAAIRNILTRVTGNNLSNIQGVLGVLGNANLFLINPNGIIFGPNARLDINGSFFASSANSIVFNNFEFSTINPEAPPLLTINLPVGLTFRERAERIIARNSRLAVQSGQTIALIGGNLNLENSTIEAPGGRVELGGLAAAGVITINPDLSLNYPQEVTRSNISITHLPTPMDVPTSIAIDVSDDGGGEIRINSADVRITESQLLAGISEEANNPEAVAGDISISATGDIEIDGGEIFNNVEGIGKGGDVDITSNSLSATNGARISASTNGEGDAGNVLIEANGLVRLNGGASSSYIESNVERDGLGNAGRVEIKADTVRIINNAEVRSNIEGRGDGGRIVIEADGLVELDRITPISPPTGVSSQVQFTADGNAGDIEIKADTVQANNGAQVRANINSRGDAGTIEIQADSLVRFDNGSEALSQVNLTGLGDAESVTIQADTVELLNGSQVRSNTGGQGNAGKVVIEANSLVRLSGQGTTASSSVQTTAVGNGGDVEIKADSVEILDNAGVRVDTSGRGNGGRIVIEANESVKFDTGGEASSGVLDRGSFGEGGNIEIRADTVEVSNGARISASTSGRGNAGNVVIEADRLVSLSGQGPAVSSAVQADAVGKGGDVEIRADSLEVINGAMVNVNTAGTGDAGSVVIEADELVRLDAENSNISTGILSSVTPGAVGNAGEIQIESDSVEVSNGAEIRASTNGQGDAGSIVIEADGLVKFDRGDSQLTTGAFSIVQPLAVGKGGDVEIKADSVEVINGAQVNASTNGQGDAGSIVIEADGLVKFDRGGDSQLATGAFSIVQPLAVGNGGDVEIRADSVEVINGAQVNASTSGQGDAGSIVIGADGLVSLSGQGTAVSSAVQEEAIGNGGDVEIRADSVEVINGAQVNASTNGIGNAGSVVIGADGLVSLSGQGTAVSSAVQEEAIGDGGDVEIRADSVEVINGAQVNASTNGQGDAGDITMTANNFTANRSSAVKTDTSTFGIAGDIILRIQDNLNLTGSTIEAITTETSTGSGGSIIIDSGNTNLRDNASISVNSQGGGDGGEISLSADDLRLEGNSRISAATADSDGGNITLKVPGRISLRDSLISATAGGRGNGGNLILESNFVILKNSNLTANAVLGDGGNITITTQQIFADPNSTITVSSEFGVDGTVTINRLETDPEQALVDLYQNPVDPEQLIGQDFCRQSSGSEFTVTGRGGLPNSPDQLQSVNEVTVGLVEPTVTEVTEANQEAGKPPAVREIVPAMGMIKDEHGNVTLVAYPTPENVSRPPLPQVSCQ